jgi:hypothetical protein
MKLERSGVGKFLNGKIWILKKISAILRRIRVLVWHAFFCIHNCGVLFGCQKCLDVFQGPID